jgi:hypothetical protein
LRLLLLLLLPTARPSEEEGKTSDFEGEMLLKNWLFFPGLRPIPCSKIQFQDLLPHSDPDLSQIHIHIGPL